MKLKADGKPDEKGHAVHINKLWTEFQSFAGMRGVQNIPLCFPCLAIRSQIGMFLSDTNIDQPLRRRCYSGIETVPARQ
jgi:hypothetical protein